jgi:exopolysaccharide production protein ExoQ
MPPLLALTLVVGLVIILLRIERRRNADASFALWIPTLWVLICGSRPLGRWIVHGSSSDIVASQDGSTLDRVVLGALLAGALLVLFRRRMSWSRIATDNLVLVLLFGYLGISILWSDEPFVSFKRWTRAVEDMIMGLVVLSEGKPRQALESVLRRSAYVLLPISVVLIKYFPDLGRAYSRWSGMEMWTGVTTHKNTLGQLCAVSVLFLIWSLFCQARSNRMPRAKWAFYADVAVVLLGVHLTVGPGGAATSATSLAVLIIGVGMMALAYKGGEISRFLVRNLKSVTIVLSILYVALYDTVIEIGTSMLGRDETLTGRTEIWAPLIEFASQRPIFGVGYGGFGDSGGNEALVYQFGETMQLSGAHNGYLAVYVETGIVGLGFLALFILAYCERVQREFDYAFEWGALGLALLPITLLYNNSEASFLQNGSYMWSVLVLFTVLFSEPCLPKKRGNENSTMVDKRRQPLKKWVLVHQMPRQS